MKNLYSILRLTLSTMVAVLALPSLAHAEDGFDITPGNYLTLLPSTSEWGVVPPTEVIPAYDAETWVAPEDGGVYFIYNVGAAQFLGAGNNWGTHVVTATPDEEAGILTYYWNDAVALSGDGSALNSGMVLPFKMTKTEDGNWYIEHMGTSRKACYLSSEADNSWIDCGTDRRIDFIIAETDGGYTIQATNTVEAATYFGAVDQDPAPEEGIPYVRNVMNNVTAETGHIVWKFAKTNYEAYDKYESVLALYNEIVAAEEAGVDASAAIAVYENEASTKEQLALALTALKALVNRAKFETEWAVAAEDNPLDVTDDCLENPTFDTDISGWFITVTGQNLGWQKRTDTNPNTGQQITNFIEAWIPSGSVLGDGVIAQTVYGLPAGKYVLECDATACHDPDDEADITGVNVFIQAGALKATAPVNTIRLGVEHFIVTFINDGSDEMTFGLEVAGTNANWISADNFKITYYGKTEQSIALATLTELVKKAEAVDIESTYALATARTAFTAALTKAQQDIATEAGDEAYEQDATALSAAQAALETSAKEYEALKALIDKVAATSEDIAEQWPDLADQLDEWAEETLTPAYENGTYTADEINSAIDNYDDMVLTIIKQIFAAAVEANEPLAKPLDITVLFNDMEFAFGTSQTAFASGYPAEEPVWMNETKTGNFKTSYSTAEVWNVRPFNIYREFTNLPKGRYTIATKAFFRVEDHEWNYENWTADGTYGQGFAYLYAGENKSNIINVAAIATDDPDRAEALGYSEIADDYGIYIPNSQLAGSKVFADAELAEKVYIAASGNVLNDGDVLRVGIAGTDDLLANQWTLWSGFTLLYNGAVTDDAMNEQLATLIAQVDETETKGVIEGEQIKEAALEQGNKALDSSSADEKTAAINALNAALAYMSESATLVDELMNIVWDYEERIMDLFGAYTDNTLLSLLDEIYDTDLDEFESNAQISAWLEQLPASWYAYILSDEGMADATVKKPYDMSALLINATFDNNNYSGWTIVNPETGAAMSGGVARYGVGEFWNGTVYNMYQELPTLKEGYWRLEVDALFRAGGAEAEQAALNVADSIPVNYEYLYASANGINASVQVVQWSDIQRGAIENTEENADLIAMLSGQYEYTSDRYNFVAPNAQSSFATFVNAERYHNTLDFKYEPANGPIRLGIRMDQTISYNWCPFDNFKLSYLGTEAPDVAILGDANMDGVVDIVDVTTIVDFILMKRQPASEQQFANADVNGDGSIDIADLTSTVSIIQGTYSALVKAERTAVAANDMLIQHGTAFELQNATGYVAFQADVTLASGAELQGVELSRRADDHIVTFRRTGENTYRIIAYSLSNTAFAGSEGELFKLSIAGEQNAEISGAVFTDGYRSCLLTAANEATGINAITDAASAAQYYDLSGRRVLTPQKGGIYVVNGKTLRVK